jgi:HK97 family phage portal protein
VFQSVISRFKSAFIKTEAKSFTLTDPEAFQLFGITGTGAGISIGPRSAMRVPAVRRAVSLIAEAVATLPFKTYTEGKEAAKDHPSYSLVHDWANDFTSAEKLREQLTTDALLTGNGFAHVRRNSEGKPVFFLRLPSASVAIEYDGFGEPSYRVRVEGGGDMVLPFYDVLHIEALDGVSPLSHAQEAVGLALAFEAHIAKLFANGGKPGGVLKTEKTLGDEAKFKLAESWKAVHGAGRSGGTAILDEGMTFETVIMTLTDAQFSENRLEQIREIARAFNVPPALLYEQSRSTWSNFEQSHRDFITNTIRPWLNRWQSAYSRVLLSPEEKGSFSIEAVTNDFESADLSSRATIYSQLRASGIRSVNEIRALENLPPVPGGDSYENPFTTTGAAPAPNSKEPVTDE